MALTATASQGFEVMGRTSGEEIFYLPGDPGDTFTRGDQVYLNNGVLDVITDSLATAIGSVVKTTVCPAASQGFPTASEYSAIDGNADDLCLVPVKMHVPAGVPIYKATFKNHKDDTVAAYSAATRSIQATTGHGTDDYPNGALIYIYGGTGAGQLNVIEDYDHTGGNVELEIITHRAWKTAPSTDSTYIVLAGEAASAKGISLLGRLDAADEDELDASDGADDGDYVVFMDWRRAPSMLANLWLPVIPVRYFYV